MKAKKGIGQLEKRLGYHFFDNSLLELALTHKSFSKTNNERLEFVGDAILGYVIATDLYNLHADVKEDSLSLMRVALVRGNILADVAAGIGLPDYIKLGGGELKSGGRERPSIIGDALEAIIGAVHEDGGVEASRSLIRKLFDKRIARLRTMDLKDPKTRLQEILQRRSLDLPSYEVESVSGKDHELHFEVKCSLSSLSISEIASGSSRRESEKSAAEKVINELKTMGYD